MRTQEEINRQIEGLREERKGVPQYSCFGTENHEIIDTQIDILKGNIELSDIDEGDFEEMDGQNQIYRGAEDAEMWLNEDSDDDLFS